MRNKRKIAGALLTVGLALFIVNFVIYVPRFGAFTQALKTWNHTTTHPFPVPADYGLDDAAFIISPVLAFTAYTLILIGGGYLLAVVVAKILRQLGYLKEEPEITKEQN